MELNSWIGKSGFKALTEVVLRALKSHDNFGIRRVDLREQAVLRAMARLKL